MSFISAESNSGLSNAPNVPVPAGAQAGDDVILVCTRDAPAENYATTKPSGFSTLDIASLTGDGQQIFVGHKKLSSAESGTYTFGTQPDSWYWVCQAFLFRGRDATDPIPVGGITVAELNSPVSSPVSITAAGLTAEEGDDLLYLAAPDTISSTTGTFTPPSGFTERTDAHADLWANLSGATKEAVSAGATGSVTGVFTASGTSAGYAAYLIRLKAASGTAVSGTFAIPAISDTPTVSPLSLTGIQSGSFPSASVTDGPVVAPVNLAGMQQGAFSGLSLSARPAVAPASLSGVQQGAFTAVAASIQPLVTPPSLYAGVVPADGTFSALAASITPEVATALLSSVLQGLFSVSIVSDQAVVLPATVTGQQVGSFPGQSATDQPTVTPVSITVRDYEISFSVLPAYWIDGYRDFLRGGSDITNARQNWIEGFRSYLEEAES
ncbi:MAG: hypothetical protein HGA87_02680 [Desulfobulbaceae bacterium]|nr:hypothetical protein [Desulfobulbaceae bacterium]